MNIRKSLFNARFWLPAIVVGAFALSSPDANAASGFNMIQPEEMNREYPYDSCSGRGAEIACGINDNGNTYYYLYGEGNPQYGGEMEGACIYGNLNAPNGVELNNILFYLDLDGKEEYYVAVWKMNQKRTETEIINSAVYGDIEEAIVNPVKMNLSGSVNTRKYLYVLQICGYGEFFAARLKYDMAE